MKDGVVMLSEVALFEGNAGKPDAEPIDDKHRKFSPEAELIQTSHQSQNNDLDPSDLPQELDAANMAFRAVRNGHGEHAATFKNRLTDYLKANYSHLTDEALQRIATVANPDKARGRKKRDVE